jgi:hypothetical protein
MTPCCTPILASWQTFQVLGELFYRGQIRTQCRAIQTWHCEHGHKSRDTATKCAEKQLTVRQKGV